MENKIKGIPHLIATDEDNPARVQITKMPQKGKLVMHSAGGEFRHYTSMGYKPQHLYITVDEKIKGGDWFVEMNLNRTPTGQILQAKNNNWNTGLDRRIVATTNPELWIKKSHSKTAFHDEEFEEDDVAKIPKSFIEQHIKLYNEGNPIKEMWLELETKDISIKEYNSREYRLKLTPDGCVVIPPKEEKMYTRAEIKMACSKACSEMPVIISSSQ